MVQETAVVPVSAHFPDLHSASETTHASRITRQRCLPTRFYRHHLSACHSSCAAAQEDRGGAHRRERQPAAADEPHAGAGAGGDRRRRAAGERGLLEGPAQRRPG